jgi:hypothetical protein
MISSDFFFGAFFSFALISASGIFLKNKFKPETVMKMLQVISETMKKSKQHLDVKLDRDMFIIKDSNHTYRFPAIPVHHLYDVKCYRDSEHTEEIDITFFRYKNHYVFSPFQPKNYGLDKVYLAVKYLTKDNFMYFRYGENEFVNIPACLVVYDASHITQPSSALAEAYD